MREKNSCSASISVVYLYIHYTAGSCFIVMPAADGNIKMEITEKILSYIKEYVPGNTAVYRIRGSIVETLYFSPGLPAVVGMSVEEYKNATQRDASGIVLPEDRASLMDAVASCISTGKPLDVRYRVKHKARNFDWVHAMACNCGTMNGCPVLLAEFTNSSIEQEALQQELEHTRDMYTQVVESAGFGVWEYDIRKHKIVSPSHSFRAFDIPDVVENVPQSILPLFPEEEQLHVQEFYRRIEAGEQRISGEFWMRWKPDLPLVCERVVYSVIKDELGNPSIAYGIGINITAQKKELEKYNRSLEELLKLNPKALCSFRLNLTANSFESGHGSSTAIKKLLTGTTVDALFNNISTLIQDPADLSEFKKQFNRIKLLDDYAAGTTAVSLKYRRRVDSDEEHSVTTRLTMLKNPESSEIAAVVYSVDSEQEETEKAIIDAIMSKEYDYIALIAMETRKISFLHIAAHVHESVYFKVDDYDAVIRSVLSSEVAPEDADGCIRDTSLDTVTAALAAKDEYIYLFRCRDGTGAMHRKQLSYRYLDQKKDRIILLRTDVTESFRQEQERNEQMHKALLKAKHADEMKTTFLSNLSHDMRTPLNAVLGYTALAQKASDDLERKEYLLKIEKAGNMLLSLINDTLDLSKIESGIITLKPEPVSCSDMIQKILTAVKPSMDAKHINFVFDNTRAVMTVINIDILRVQEIFVNLLSNAIKFTPANGTVTLAVECTKLEKNCVHDRITVRDTGCGMSREFIPKLFEPFTQERTERNADVGGSGLGLSIVKRLVEMMGGTIAVHSELEKGTEFTVCLDFERLSDVQEQKTAAVAAKKNIRGLHVLLCEDNEMNTEIAKNLLEMYGVTVTCANNGQQGVDIFESSAPGTFDVILMDIRMPVLNGYEAVRKLRGYIRRDAASIPIIAMSADAYDDDVKKSLEAGMNGHISKPVNPDKLFSELSRVTQKL